MKVKLEEREGSAATTMVDGGVLLASGKMKNPRNLKIQRSNKSEYRSCETPCDC